MAALSIPALASAQGSPVARAAEAADGADIVVQAQRRPVPAQEVAATVDVFTGDELRATGTRTFEGLARIDPSVQLSAYQGETQLFVRGIGAVTFIGGYDSSVAVFSNDVYLSRPSAVAPALFDLERVEILKGPQGSLYGRNATGGAVLLVNRVPGRTWEGEASLRAGNYSNVDVFGAVGGPLGDTLAFRLAVGTNNHSGYTRLNFGSASGGEAVTRRAEDQHDVSTRLSLLWQPSDPVSVLLVGDYYRASDRAVVFHFAGPGYANNPLFLARIGQGEVGPYGTRDINTSQLPFNRPRNGGVSGKVSVELPFATLASLTAFRRTRPRNFDDLSNSTVLGESQFKEERSSQFTQDVTLTSLPGSTTTFVLGSSFFHENDHIRNEYFFPFLLDYLGLSGSADCCLLKANGTTRTNSVALFAEGETPIVGRLSAIAGGRWTKEWKSGANLLEFTNFQTVNDAPFDRARFSAFTPKVGLQYRWSGSVQMYATASKGFKAGGYNIGTADNAPFRPEKIWSYEVGARARIDALKLVASASAFHYDYSDLQVQDVANNTVVIRNAATAKVDGVEASVRFAPASRVSLEASGTYLHARLSSYRTVNLKTQQLGVLDLSGNPLPQAPKLKGRVSGEYGLPIGDAGRLDFRADVMWQDRIYFSAFKDPRAMQRQYAWLKGRIGFRPSRGRYEVAAFVDNVANVHAFTNISITGDLDASRANGNLAPPRTFGMQVTRVF